MATSLFAPFSLTTQSLSDVFSRFSDMMENRLILHIEDAPIEEGTRWNEELKTRLTASEFEVEKKFLQSYRTRGFCRVVLSTNAKKVLRLTPEDRRWAAFECSDELAGNIEYFSKLAQHWPSVRVQQAVLIDVLSIDVDAFSCEKDIPVTDYLKFLRGEPLPKPTFDIPATFLPKNKSVDPLLIMTQPEEIDCWDDSVSMWEEGIKPQSLAKNFGANRGERGLIFEMETEKKIKKTKTGEETSIVSYPLSGAVLSSAEMCAPQQRNDQRDDKSIASKRSCITQQSSCASTYSKATEVSENRDLVSEYMYGISLYLEKQNSKGAALIAAAELHQLFDSWRKTSKANLRADFELRGFSRILRALQPTLKGKQVGSDRMRSYQIDYKYWFALNANKGWQIIDLELLRQQV